jgi:hypothetical protein
MKTTTKNYQQHLGGISILSLPQTFRDAIDVTKALEISYIWIDALAIIQDDKDDWLAETGKMCDVYRNAILPSPQTMPTPPPKASSPRIFMRNAYFP